MVLHIWRSPVFDSQSLESKNFPRMTWKPSLCFFHKFSSWKLCFQHALLIEHHLLVSTLHYDLRSSSWEQTPPSWAPIPFLITASWTHPYLKLSSLSFWLRIIWGFVIFKGTLSLNTRFHLSSSPLNRGRARTMLWYWLRTWTMWTGAKKWGNH